MATGSVFSQTLQSITTAKLAELARKRTTFDAQHQESLEKLDAQSDPLARVTALLAGVKHSFGIASTGSSKWSSSAESRDRELSDELLRLDLFLEQAQFDPSVSGRILTEWETALRRRLDVQARRYEYATLYGQLVTEWLSSSATKDNAGVSIHSVGDVEVGDDSFDELPGRQRMEAREDFEKALFTPENVDEGALKQYLSNLFTDNPEDESKPIAKALASLRDSAANFEAELAESNPFHSQIVARAIRGLLKSDLFAGEKRTVLKDFESSTTILSEIADVLNMRMSALDVWTWDTSDPGSKGVSVEQRRKLNGRFDIFMHEDLLQAIFLQHIGVEWSVFFKTVFKRLRRTKAWTSNFRQLSRTERKRREYYLGPQETEQTLARKRRRTHRKGYFVYQLLDSAEQEIEQKDGEEEAEFQEEFSVPVEAQAKFASVQAPAKRKGMGSGGAKRHRKIHVAKEDDEESDDGTEEMYSPKEPMEKKQDLLHLLATEANVNKQIHGSFTAFRSVFNELQNSLSHAAVMTVLDFFGVSAKWRDFFARYLEAPLRFMDEDETDSQPRQRKRGAPASHVLSDVFSETMLFCLDFSVNRLGQGAFLYRLADDFWFWSHDHAKAVAIWQEIQSFAKMTALSVNRGKSGSVVIGGPANVQPLQGSQLPGGRIRWGMLFFDIETVSFKIDQKMVDQHTAELRKQLAAKNSVFDWIQAWNAYANTFFASNFGHAANCFGRQHVDDILTTHRRVQTTLFDGKSAAEHLKQMIGERFGIHDVADGFLLFPVKLGGVELRSPFVSPLQIRNNVAETPSKILDKFQEDEKQQYRDLKAAFDKGQDPGTPDSENPQWRPAEGADEFMSFEEFVKYREDYTPQDAENQMLIAYDKLLERPLEREIIPSAELERGLEKLGSPPHAQGITDNWFSMDAYWKWVAQLYGPDLLDRFGGLRVVEPGLLPIGMVSLFRDQKVKWQG